MDLAGKEYWERVWKRPRGRGVEHLSYFYWRFTRLLKTYAPPGSSACEIGCGSSVWVPFLAAHGVRMAGIDYSEAGLELLRRRLDERQVSARLVHGDVFEPNALAGERFDLIFSLGFIEHFDGGAAVLERLAEYVRPGGVMVTLVPNLVGVWGTVQKWIDPEVYGIHTRYTCEALDDVHAAAGLQPVCDTSYFGGFGAASVNYSRFLRRWPLATRWVMRGVWIAQQAVSWPAALLPGGGESRWLSAYVVGVYRR